MIGKNSEISKGALGSAHHQMGRRSGQHEPGQPPALSALGKRLAAGSLQVKARISRGVPLIFPSSSPHANLLLLRKFLPGEFTAATS